MPDGQIRTEFKIKKEYEIPSNTVARIMSADLLGSKIIVFNLGNSTTLANDGDPLTSDVQQNLMEKVEPLQKKVENIAARMDSVLVAVNAILDKDFQKDVKRSVHSISVTMKNIEGITGEVNGLLGTEKARLGRIMANLESITVNFKNNGKKLDHIMNNLDNVSDQMAKIEIKSTVDKANQAMQDVQDITNKINNGDGSISLLLNDDKLYNNLNSASEELDNLIKDVKNHPGKYIRLSIFGKKDTK